MAYQETKTTGYGTRLSNSVKGIGTGFLLLLAGTVLLWWNEGRAVKTAEMLEEAQGVTVHVEDVSQPDPSLDGKLIHATAFTRTADSLCDVTFGIGAVAVRLERTVQYYQWVEDAKTETRDKIGGGQEEVTTYTYSRKWVGSPVNSQEFKDADYRQKNFVVMNLEDECYLAENVTFGAYRLPENLISSISGTVPMELDFSKGQLKQWDRDVRMCFESKAKAEPDSTAVPDNVPACQRECALFREESERAPDRRHVHNIHESIAGRGHCHCSGQRGQAAVLCRGKRQDILCPDFRSGRPGRDVQERAPEQQVSDLAAAPGRPAAGNRRPERYLRYPDHSAEGASAPVRHCRAGCRSGVQCTGSGMVASHCCIVMAVLPSGHRRGTRGGHHCSDCLPCEKGKGQEED